MKPLRIFLMAALFLVVLGLSGEAEAHSGDIFSIIISDNGIQPAVASLSVRDTARFINVDDTENLTHRILVDADSDGKYNGGGDLDSGDLTNSCETDGNGTKLDENCNAFFDIFFDESFLGKSNNDIVGTYAFVDLASNGVKSFGNLTVEFDCHGTIAAFNWSYTNDTGGIVMGVAVEGLPQHFNAGGSDDSSDCPLTYEWDFGDGANGTGITVEHVFNDIPENGFNVALTVTDSSGNQDVVSYNIHPARKVRPDLYISSIDFSNDNPEIGEEVTITVMVNLLEVNVTDNFLVGFYLDAIDGTEIGLKEINLTMGIGHSRPVSINWAAIDGTHTIVVVVDLLDVIDESEEKNEVSKVITVGFVEPEPDETTDTTEETTTETGASDTEDELDYTLPIIGIGVLIAVSILGAAVILKR